MVVSKEKFVNSALWKIAEQFSTKGVSMIVSIVLARLLLPEDYGLIALTTVFINLSDIFIDGGFGTALVRKEKIDSIDIASVFTISFCMALFLYLVLFFSAPVVASYYKEEKLSSLLRVIGLVFFIHAIISTRTAMVTRNMQYNILFTCDVTSAIVSGIVGIFAAYIGLGVWSLVIQRLLQEVLVAVFLFSKIHLQLKFQLEWGRVKELLKFSVGVVGASLLNYIGGNLSSAVIGKRYSVSDLGYYDKGGQLPMQLSLYTFGAMSGVLLPTLSSCQNEKERVKLIVRKVTGMTAYLIFPLMVGLALVTKETIILLFTQKWLPAAEVMAWSCLYYLATPFMLINIQVFFALGHSEKRVKIELIRLAVIALSIMVFVEGLKCSMNQLAAINAFIAVFSSFMSFVEVKKMITYKVTEVVHDLAKPLVITVIMAVAVIGIGPLLNNSNMSNILQLFIKVGVGGIIYLVGSFLVRPDGFEEIKKMLLAKVRFQKGE